MPTYTIQVTVKLHAEDEREACSYVRTAINTAKKADIEHIESDVIETEADDEDEPLGKFTRNERLQGMADRGCDTWAEYRGER